MRNNLHMRPSVLLYLVRRLPDLQRAAMDTRLLVLSPKFYIQHFMEFFVYGAILSVGM